MLQENVVKLLDWDVKKILQNIEKLKGTEEMITKNDSLMTAVSSLLADCLI